ncbi:hypothetical protein QBC37DRAFT_443892 [Rhypophila decipiens]|uniref:FAD/NAD(P)-binding domain-containing protein n=1 Tax=Rhypophila decipiens TaxID=261697 RepID=A0AAN6XXL2_9PEZI|nr:hypothetical protein QBC37DRAFT_443892 [Rhypophila decipiens]
MDISNVDILIIGAGLSGINAGYRIQKELPHKSFAILEGRSEVGGTWSFWKYPGIRSDSTMRVFGLPWYPWPSNVVMADGPVIRQYLEDAATSQGLDRKIHLNHKVTCCDWSSAENCWTLSINLLSPTDGTIINQKEIKANWIINAAGYYSYEKPLPVSIPGIENFSGRVIHPQFWDSDGKVDFSNKRVVIIGSGATAITLLPAIAKTAAKVTLLQRSPSYVFSLDSQDHNLDFWARFLPDSWAKTFHWWQCLIMESFFRVLLSNLLVGKRLVQAEMRKQLPPGFDLETHFNPSYPPFEQRLCFCPDGDFFKALSQPNTEIVTGTISTVTSSGIDLNPGAKSSSSTGGPNKGGVNSIPCDMIITATGLYVDIISSLQISVSTLPNDPTYSPERFTLTPEILSSLQTWNGTMIESLPNQAKIVGYTAGTWTPGANARTSQIINVIRHMDLVGANRVFPVVEKEKEMEKKPVMPNSSSYLVDARSRLPIAAGRGPWRNAQSVWEDWAGIWRTWVPVRVARLFGVRMGECRVYRRSERE